jgi:hypothetical protein
VSRGSEKQLSPRGDTVTRITTFYTSCHICRADLPLWDATSRICDLLDAGGSCRVPRLANQVLRVCAFDQTPHLNGARCISTANL